MITRQSHQQSPSCPPGQRVAAGLTLAGFAASISLVLAAAAPVAAVVAPPASSPPSALVVRHPDLYIPNVYQPVGELPLSLSLTLTPRLQALGVPAGQAFFDLRGGRFGTLILRQPLLPGGGAGNDLEWADLGLAPPGGGDAFEEAAWQALVAYLAVFEAQLGIDPGELAEEPGVTAHDGGRLVQISAPRAVAGVRVRESYLTAVLNGGNLVLFGARNWGDVEVDPRPAISADDAAAVIASHVASDHPLLGFWAPARLEIVPLANGAELGATPVGEGYVYRLAWVVSAKLQGDLGTWEGLVDAHTGELLAFTDVNRYHKARIMGGIFPVSNDGTPPDGVEQPGFPMPFADVVEPFGAAPKVTNSYGVIDDAGSALRTTLAGPFVRMKDFCGAIDELATCGDLDLGAGPGTDCVVPPGHSAGDTHASRSGFYEVNRITEAARALLPGNAWLGEQLTANMNIEDTCNAFWDGQTINFFKSGTGCANTGEIAAVFDHEWGHGLDDNDTNGEISAPGESIADIYGFLRVSDSCFGRGFRPGVACDGYGDACLGCTGVRELDFEQHASGEPHDIAWVLSPTVAPGGGCVGVAGIQFGPCNQETHCEGMVAAEAAWDLFSRDLQGAPFGFDFNTALQTATRLVYQGAGTIANWYQCDPGGTIAGCNADGGYLNLLAADDDNGNLADGTPHMAAIFAAFDRHQIACATPAVVNSGCGGGPAGAPALTVAPLPEGAHLSWTAVDGASRYAVYRTEGVKGCDFGKVKVAEVTGTTFDDSGLREGFELLYSVEPIGTSGACTGPMSACQAVIPAAAPVEEQATMVFREVRDGLRILTGDGDVFADNCEIVEFAFEVENAGSLDLTDVTLESVASPSHPGTQILTPLPSSLAATLPGGACGSPDTIAAAAFRFVPQGVAFDETMVFEFTIGADSADGPVTLAGRMTVTGTESDFQFLDVLTFGFETGFDGWRQVSGMYTRQQPGANGTLFHLASSSLTPSQCDEIQSPQIRLTPTSTLSLFNQYQTEPGTPVLGFYDRANVGILEVETGARTTVSPDGGRPYDASGPGGVCVTQGEPGWAGLGAGFAASSWSATALEAERFAGRRVRLDLAYGTDPNVEATGFQFDEVTLTDFELQVADAFSNACEAVPEIQANDDAATTAEGEPVVIAVLANDFTESPPLTVDGVTDPPQGTATVNGDGTITYTPDPGFAGEDGFSYTARDADGRTDSAMVTVTVTDEPDACAEPGLTILTDAAGDATGGQPAHDVRSLAMAQPVGGSDFVFTLKMTGLPTPLPPNTTWPVVFQTPDGTDRFVKMASDALGAPRWEYGLGINPSVAGTPAGPGSSFTADGTIRIVVPGAALGDPQAGQQLGLFLTRIRQEVAGGSALTPDNMPDSLARSGSYTVASCEEDQPTAVDDTATTELNQPVVIDVLANDSDPNADPLTVQITSQPTAGQATVNPDQTVTYTPDNGFLGQDTFTYEACDPDSDCDGATVTVTVTCPQTADGSFSDDFEPAPQPGWEVDTAANALPVSLTWQPVADPFAHSAITSFFSDATTLELKDDRLVAPAQDLSATSQLVFWHRFEFEGGFDGGVLEISTDGGATWSDLGGAITSGGYNGMISAGDGSPIAGRPAWTGASQFFDAMTQVVVDLGAYAGHDVLVRWRLAADPLAVGSLPGTGWWIDDVQFTNTLRTAGSCPLPPEAVDDAATTEKNQPVTIAVLDNDSDPNGDALHLGEVSDPAHGTAQPNPDDTVTYTPDPNFAGADSFTYEACDDGGLCDTATVTVTVQQTNAAPDAVDDAATTRQDKAVTINVLANDNDPDGDDLQVVGVTDPEHGTAVINPDDTVTYTPDPGYHGDDSFRYTVSDGSLTDTAEVRVTVEEKDGQGGGPGKVNGGGWIPDGSGRANFSLNAKASAPPPKGRIRYDAQVSGVKMKGTVTGVTFPAANQAELSGPCELGDGSPCTFEATATDNGEPGSADRLRISIFGPGGGLIHQADRTLDGGNIQVH